MAITCKIAGHKWNGCSCSRCGARNPDWTAKHSWGAAEPLADPGMAGRARKEHKVTCTGCGEHRHEPHNFEAAPDCIVRCTACGYELVWHDFADGACTRCGADESGYYRDLILMGLVRLSDREEVPCEGMRFPDGGRTMRYADHLGKASDLASVARAYVPRGFDAFEELKDQRALNDCVRRLGELAAGNGDGAAQADRALYELALSGPDRLRARAALLVRNPELASDPAIRGIVARELERDEANRAAGERYLTSDGV